MLKKCKYEFYNYLLEKTAFISLGLLKKENKIYKGKHIKELFRALLVHTCECSVMCVLFFPFYCV